MNRIDEEPTAFARAIDTLVAQGINHLAFVPRGGSEASGFAGILLGLSLGAAFYERQVCGAPAMPHPFDQQSAALMRAFGEQLGPSGRRFTLVYPGDAPLDLRRLLEESGVQFRSPIGIGIRPDCGPWLAVRAAAETTLSDAEVSYLEARFPRVQPEAHPCRTCEGTPCVAACPAGAVPSPASADVSLGMPQKALDLCIDHRLQPASACAYACLARSACPVGRSARYGDAQMRHHYAASLTTLRRWRATGEC